MFRALRRQSIVRTIFSFSKLTKRCKLQHLCVLTSFAGTMQKRRKCYQYFFSRASERRVLPIVGVCISSSHLHTLSHEMRADAQKLVKNCDFTCPRATLSHEMRVDRQKLGKNCDFTCPRATISHEMRIDRQKLR